tara:strand:+ start:62 stop:412 length:351 start_codon:yes stop_codon:yes gene_type:complete
MNFVYYTKEYFAVMFYFLIIFNIILSVIYSKSKKISKKKSTKRRNRKGGGLRWFLSLAKLILCFLTFGLYCPGRGKDYTMWGDTKSLKDWSQENSPEETVFDSNNITDWNKLWTTQ